MSRLLVGFDGNREIKPDFAEKVGDFGLLLLRAGFGKMVTMVTMATAESKNGGTKFLETNFSTVMKVFTIIGFFLTLPLSGLFAAIGAVATACSNSHKQMYKSYTHFENTSKKGLSNIDNDNTNKQLIEIGRRIYNNEAFSGDLLGQYWHFLPSNLVEQGSSQEENAQQPTKQQKKVGFGDVRARDFEKEKPADQVGNANSIVLNSVRKR